MTISPIIQFAGIMSQQDIELIESIWTSANPLTLRTELFSPAVVKGVQYDDIAFTLTYHETTDEVFDKLVQWAARELGCDPVQANFQAMRGHDRRPFSMWLEYSDPSLYLRAVRIVTLGLKPWEEQAVADYDNQLDAAGKVLASMTS